MLRAYVLRAYALMMRAYVLRVITRNVEGLCPDWYHTHVEVVSLHLSSVGVVIDALSLLSSCQ